MHTMCCLNVVLTFVCSCLAMKKQSHILSEWTCGLFAFIAIAIIYHFDARMICSEIIHRAKWHKPNDKSARHFCVRSWTILWASLFFSISHSTPRRLWIIRAITSLIKSNRTYVSLPSEAKSERFDFVVRWLNEFICSIFCARTWINDIPESIDQIVATKKKHRQIA